MARRRTVRHDTDLVPGVDAAECGSVAIGDSQSGNFIRSFIHLGFNEGADGRAVWDGAFPRIAARQTPINV